MDMSLFGALEPHKQVKCVKYPPWDDVKRRAPKRKMYRLSAPDFGVSLDPSPKARAFSEYEDELVYRLIMNDGTDQALMWLTMARNIFHRELSQMPENYISKLVFNRYHRTVILSRGGQVLGGICFRPFPDLDFAEIAFCAVSSLQQIRGYGGHLMAQVKTYLQALSIHNILTYADNSAVGYFRRQGFTLEINLDPKIWCHCIKDYQGATLIHCKIHPDVDYLHMNVILDRQKNLASEMMPDAELLEFSHFPVTTIKGIKITAEPKINIMDQMRLIVMKTKQHRRAWPFRKAVSKSEAPNYLEIVSNPMDLSLLEKNVGDGKYRNMREFEADLRLIFSNCYLYNGRDSVYAKSAQELEQYVDSLLAKTRSGVRRP